MTNNQCWIVRFWIVLDSEILTFGFQLLFSSKERIAQAAEDKVGYGKGGGGKHQAHECPGDHAFPFVHAFGAASRRHPARRAYDDHDESNDADHAEYHLKPRAEYFKHIKRASPAHRRTQVGFRIACGLCGAGTKRHETVIEQRDAIAKSFRNHNV